MTAIDISAFTSRISDRDELAARKLWDSLPQSIVNVLR